MLTVWGIEPFRYPFLDWEGVAAGARCWRAGVNVYAANPCDVLNRAHNYSPLWLRAGFLPFGPVWRNVMGVAIALCFYAAALVVARPRTWGEALVFAAAGCSTMVVFAIERGNVDAAIFAVVTLAVVLSMRRGWGFVAYSAYLLLGLLKFYPLVLLGTAIRERPRVLAAIAAASGLALAAFLLAFGPELQRMAHNFPAGGYFSDLFGAGNLPRGLANMREARRFAVDLADLTPDRGVHLALRATLAGACMAGALVLARSERLLAAFDAMGELDRRLLVAGAALIAGCFFAGQSIGYRGVHLLFVVGGLLPLRRELSDAAGRRLVAALVVVVLLLMWDGAARHVLELHGRRTVRTLYWLLREGLWHVLVAVLIGVLGLFVRRSPLAVRRPVASA